MPIELTSPPPIGWKVCSPYQAVTKEYPDIINKCKHKKLIFQSSPEVEPVQSGLKEETGCNISSEIVPTIVVIDDGEENYGLDGSDKNLIVSPQKDRLKVPTKKYASKRNKFTTPKKCIAVFSDDQENKILKSSTRKCKRTVASDSHDIDGGKNPRSDMKSITKRTDKNDNKHISKKSANLLAQKRLFDTENVTETPDKDGTPPRQNCSSDDSCSIVDATIIEESTCPSKFQLVASNLKENLENKMSTLCISPNSPIAVPLPLTTIKKYTRRPKSELTSSKNDHGNIGPNSEKSTSKGRRAFGPDQLDSSPKIKMTRSARKLFSTKNIN